MNNETKETIKEKIANITIKIAKAQAEKDLLKDMLDRSKLKLDALILEKNKIKEDLPA